MRTCRWLILFLGLLTVVPPLASAQTGAPPAPAALEAAKDFFRKGNAEMEAGNHERALEYFLQSRAQVPSIANTNNAGLALERLGRLDEALQLYEELLQTFAPSLSSEERAAVSNKVASLRTQIGSLEVSANVEGTLILDGKKRGTVPRTAPLRVMPGPHSVRILKDGYTPAEATVVIQAGQSTQVDLRLEALTSVGRLLVTDASGAAGVEVLVDGAPVGVAPWEGSLGPGRHLIALQGKDVGTAPVAINVLAGQIVRTELKAVRLGPPLSVVFEPITAPIFLDGVEIGKGLWRGRLPAGEHTFEAREEGYLPGIVQVGVAQNSVTFPLKIDEAHPRWRQPARGKWRLGVVIGAATSGNLGSDAERTGGDGDRSATGGTLEARLSFHLPNRLNFDVRAGVLQLDRSFSRSLQQGTTTYNLTDSLQLRGLMAQVGVGFDAPLSRRISFQSRLGFGFLSLRARDPIQGFLTTGTGQSTLQLEGAGAASRGGTIVVVPSLGADLQLGRSFHLGLGLGAIVSLLDGPRFEHGDALSAQPCSPANPASCVQGSRILAQERAYSRFLVWTPQLSLGADFLGL
ncbi:MAG: PEGA domain-containing protein [Polyangiaceae bacterium]|nr:PEGA domain-containing protein [Polyangiaceae bacterium]